MPDPLNQQDIDELARRARVSPPAGGATARARARAVAACNFRTVGQISREETVAITRLHEPFARNLAHSLGAYLRTMLELSLASAEQLTYSEFLSRVPEITYLASLRMMPLDVAAAVHIDLSIAFPIIDVLLGGKGEADFQAREVTDIEDGILENIVRLISRELHAAWEQILPQEFEYEQRWQAAQIMQFMSPNERVLVIGFDLKMAQASGQFHVLLPALASGALLRRLSIEYTGQKRRGTPEELARIRTRLLQCPFAVELLLPGGVSSVRELMALEPNQVLPLNLPLDSPAYLAVAGLRLYLAAPARSGALRASHIKQRLSLAEKGKSHDEL